MLVYKLLIKMLSMTTQEIRRRRLKEWFSEKSLPEKEKSYLSQLINGRSSFGERAARRLERDYGMPSGFLDSDTSDSQSTQPGLVLSDEELKLITFFVDSLTPQRKKR